MVGSVTNGVAERESWRRGMRRRFRCGRAARSSGKEADVTAATSYRTHDGEEEDVYSWSGMKRDILV